MREMTQRQIQASELFKRKLSNFWIKDDYLLDKDLKSITITEVRLNPDFSIANVFYTHSKDDKAIQQELKRINKTLRFELTKIMDMKKMPEIKFLYDNTLDEVGRIEKLLSSDKVKKDLSN